MTAMVYAAQFLLSLLFTAGLGLVFALALHLASAGAVALFRWLEQRGRS